MKAVLRPAYGGPDTLEFTTTEVPTPAAGELLVRVHAASLNMADWHLMTGEPLLVRPQLGWRRPRRPRFGSDAAGVVEAIGPDVDVFVVGDRVVGNSGGAFAELAILRASHAALVPEGVAYTEAATLPIAGVTALQAVRDHGHVGPGDRVLVNGAAGGVGHFAVQIARLLGAEVTGISSARNHDLVRRLGATEVIDHTTTDYTTLGREWDVIIDVQGNHRASRNRRVLARDGRWVIIGGPKPRVLGPVPYAVSGLARFAVAPQSASMLLAAETTERLDVLVRWLADGALVPTIERTFTLPEVADAMRHLGTGRTRGKLVVDVAT